MRGRSRSRALRRGVLVAVAFALVASSAPSSSANGDALVSAGSPSGPSPRNAQNEPALAVDPVHPNILAAGANEFIDMEPCNPTGCPITDGVGASGIYFSFDSGHSWTQPTYSGFSARTLPANPAGPIGTIPWYTESGLQSSGDPALAFGPVPGPNGRFSWANGSRLYYATLSNPYPSGAKPGDRAVKGGPIAVSRTDDVSTAAQGGSAGKSAWMHPVIASSKDSPSIFEDKEMIWADNAESSPRFGTVYVCYVAFRKSGAHPLVVARSTDGGTTWRESQVTGAGAGRQGCTLRTDSHGTLFVFVLSSTKGQLMFRSFDGGKRFEPARGVASGFTAGAPEPNGRTTFDGVAGADANSFPSVDIANGAPGGAGATDTIVLSWLDARQGLNHEEALVQTSTDAGLTWTAPMNLAEAPDRPDFPAVAISPDGTDVYLVYNGFLDPYRSTFVQPRRMQGVVRHAEVGTGGQLTNATTLHRGTIGDVRGAGGKLDPRNRTFIGDYNYAVATNTYGSAVWTDVRNATVCPALNDYRDRFLLAPSLPFPDLASTCPTSFGNTDIFGFTGQDPTP